MNNLTAERFNVAGALVAKLFGRPGADRDEFARRARGVRDVGIRSAMYGRVLFVALGLVAAVGTAVVYLDRRQPRRSRARSRSARSRRSCSTSGRSTSRSRSSRTRASRCSPRWSRSSACSRCSTSRRRSPTEPGADELRRATGRVEFDHVWFRHPAGAQVSLASLEGLEHAGIDRTERVDPRATSRSRSSRARRSRSSDRPARARRRSRCSCRA